MELLRAEIVERNCANLRTRFPPLQWDDLQKECFMQTADYCNIMNALHGLVRMHTPEDAWCKMKDFRDALARNHVVAAAQPALSRFFDGPGGTPMVALTMQLTGGAWVVFIARVRVDAAAVMAAMPFSAAQTLWSLSSVVVPVFWPAGLVPPGPISGRDEP